MKITAITKFKQGDLWNAMNAQGWTQSDLARRAGLSPMSLGGILNLKRRPSRRSATAIQNAFGEVGVFFDILQVWPETFAGTGRRLVVERTEDMLTLGDRAEDVNLMQIEQIETDPDNGLRDRLEKALATLPDPEAIRILKGRYGYDGGEKSLEELAKPMKRSRERVRQIEAKALRMLRHPSREKIIRGEAA